MMLVTAGWDALTDAPWWRWLATVGVVVSQIAITTWWADAATGTIPNLLIVAGLISTHPLHGPDTPPTQANDTPNPTDAPQQTR